MQDTVPQKGLIEIPSADEPRHAHAELRQGLSVVVLLVIAGSIYWTLSKFEQFGEDSSFCFQPSETSSLEALYCNLILQSGGESEKSSAQIYFESGQAFRHENEWIDAIDAYTNAIAEDRNFYPAYLGRGITKTKAARFESALQDFSIILKKHPNHYLTLVSALDAANRAKQYDRAVEYADRAIAVKPEEAYSYEAKGYALRSLGKYRDAVEAFSEALDRNPDKASMWQYRADLRYAIADYDGVLMDAAKAIEMIEAIDTFSLRLRGMAYTQIAARDNDSAYYEKASVELEKVLAAYAKDDIALQFLGLAKWKMGNAYAAVADLQAAIAIDNRNSTHHELLGQIFESQMEWNKALVSYESALELQPINADVSGARDRMRAKVIDLATE